MMKTEFARMKRKKIQPRQQAAVRKWMMGKRVFTGGLPLYYGAGKDTG